MMTWAKRRSSLCAVPSVSEKKESRAFTYRSLHKVKRAEFDCSTFFRFTVKPGIANREYSMYSTVLLSILPGDHSLDICLETCGNIACGEEETSRHMCCSWRTRKMSKWKTTASTRIIVLWDTESLQGLRVSESKGGAFTVALNHPKLMWVPG